MVKQNIAASVRSRLKTAAQKRGIPFQLALTQYGLERFLFRLGESDESESFYLKGAMLFNLWYVLDSTSKPLGCWELPYLSLMKTSLRLNVKQLRKLRHCCLVE